MDDSIPHCLSKRSTNKRVIREVPLESDEDATGGGIASENTEQNNSNFDGERAKEEENSPDTMMIYDDDSPTLAEEGEEGKEIKLTTNNSNIITTIKSSLIGSTSTIKAETTTKETIYPPKNLTNEKNKSEKSLKVLEEMKKLSGTGKLLTIGKNEIQEAVGINNNSEKTTETIKIESIKNEDSNKSKSHRRNCNSELLRRIILEVFNDNVSCFDIFKHLFF